MPTPRAPKPAAEKTLILSLSGAVVAVDARTGARRWEHRTPFPAQQLLVTPLHVLVVYEKAADRLDRVTGAIVSRFPLPFRPQTVVADGEDVLFAVASNVLRVAPDGVVQWRIAAEPWPRRSLGQVSWLVFRDADGVERWRTEGDAFYAGSPAQIITVVDDRPRRPVRKKAIPVASPSSPREPRKKTGDGEKVTTKRKRS